MVTPVEIVIVNYKSVDVILDLVDVVVFFVGYVIEFLCFVSNLTVF